MMIAEMKTIPILCFGQAAGELSFDGRIYSFTYDNDWLANGFPICPSLPLEDKIFTAKEFFSVFHDASPDAWGSRLLQHIEVLRAAIEKRNPRILDDFAIFERADNFVRQGALEVGFDDIDSLALNDTALLMKSCEYIESLSVHESDPRVLFAFIKNRIGSGGARPKFNILKNDELWLCKCPSSEDKICEQGWEAVNLTLAKMAGLNVPDFAYDPELKLLSVKRFDRKSQEKIPYISAATLLEKKEGSYTEIAHLCQPKDKQELFRRICLNMLVANFDDHLKNHGFLLQQGSWNLSPLFDVQTMPQSLNMPFHATDIVQGNALSDISLLVQSSDFFGIAENQGRDIVHDMIDTVSAHWEKLALQYALHAEIPYMKAVYTRFSKTQQKNQSIHFTR